MSILSDTNANEVKAVMNTTGGKPTLHLDSHLPDDLEQDEWVEPQYQGNATVHNYTGLKEASPENDDYYYQPVRLPETVRPGTGGLTTLKQKASMLFQAVRSLPRRIVSLMGNSRATRRPQAENAISKRKPMPGPKPRVTPSDLSSDLDIPMYVNDTQQAIAPGMHGNDDVNGLFRGSIADLSNICEIPKTEQLTVEDVTECLKQLRLGEYIECFKDEQVDGKLLLGLDEDMLQREFGMTKFHAVKLMKFARGWRPYYPASHE